MKLNALLAGVLTLAFFLTSCNNELNDNLETESKLKDEVLLEKPEMMVFADWDNYYELYKTISNNSEEELREWSYKNNPNSMINYYLELFDNEVEISVEEEDKLYVLTNGLKAILNKDGAFQVEKNIIIYEDGNFFSVPSKEYYNFDDNKQSRTLDLYDKIGSISLEILDSKNSIDDNSKELSKNATG